MKIKQVRLEKYKQLLANRKLNFLFVQYSYMDVEEWRLLRQQGDILIFTIQVVRKGLLNGCFSKQPPQVDFSGANALIIFNTSPGMPWKQGAIIDFVKRHPKLYLLGARLANQQTYQSLKPVPALISQKQQLQENQVIKLGSINTTTVNTSSAIQAALLQFQQNAAVLNNVISYLSTIEILTHHYIKLLQLLYHANNKSSGS